ncbi:MAG: ATPase [Candidatus Hydrothermarchaeota archaeon]|nr:MAG: ATPase [Candidatus Hydrothermarchaeota archaeon]
MIETLEIANFKSIKHLRLDCKRINIFIGKPNSGKSNILESLGIFSFPYKDLRSFVRFESPSNLFYDENIEEKVTIKADNNILEIEFKEGSFRGKGINIKQKTGILDFNIDYEGSGSYSYSEEWRYPPIKFYRFVVRKDFPRKESEFLLPPSGENLLAIFLTHKELRKVIANIFSEYGLRIVLKPQENKIEVQKEIEDIIISYPYSLVSDTLQRVVFHLVAIETNKNSVIIFEEPEAHAFPYYTKFLAERMALDKKNQYFISTHNPYFILSILEKASSEELGIFITYFEDYQTKIKSLSKEEIEELMGLGADLFFNIERFLEE